MIQILQTDKFSKWLKKLKDNFAKVAILRRIERIQSGNFGDCKSVGEEVFELRLDYGPGYRIYYKYSGSTIIILLVGGDKSSQQKDIETAKKLAKEVAP